MALVVVVKVPTTPPIVTDEMIDVLPLVADLCFTHTRVPGETVPELLSASDFGNPGNPGNIGDPPPPPQFSTK